MRILKKIAVILPVLMVSMVFLGMHYFRQYQHATPIRLFALVASVVLFYIWVISGVTRRTQNSFFEVLMQSSFYVYIFSVLTLTGYFILFNQISGHDWWHKTLERVNRREGVNLEPFFFLKRRLVFNYDTVGNFFMLLPLGIYLPLLYKNIKGLFAVTFVAMLISASIELMQLATSVRIADINDVILNAAGAAVGFVIYFILYTAFKKSLNSSRQVQAYS